MRQVSYSQLKTVTRGITVPGAGGGIHTVERAFLQQCTGGSIEKSSRASQPIRDFTTVVQPPVQKTLQQYLGNGEYPSFQSIAMFESSFIQVTRKGKQAFLHNNCNRAIVGIATTNPKLPLPNVMFMARPTVGQISSGQHTEELMLTRLIPLKFVRISIHDSKKQLIKIKLINRRSYYLQLYSSTEDEKALFDCWLSLVHLLHHPPWRYLRQCPRSRTTADSLSVQVVSSEIDTKLDHMSDHISDHISLDTEDEVLEVESDALPLEKKATKTVFPSRDTVVGENYTEPEDYLVRTKSVLQDINVGESYTQSEDDLLRTKSVMLTSSRRSLGSGWDSFENYKDSSTTSEEASK
uniref:Uncharacterized protein n=1 Tax=Sphaerodactylus townsendi TaxID=933632 RepID=A0ACB8G8S4_9SAUR